MKYKLEANKQIDTKKLSRRKVVSLLGLGILATQFPFACKNGIITLSDLEKKGIHYLTLSEVADLIKSKKYLQKN